MRSPDVPRPAVSPWMRPVLIAAGVYNLLWGAAVVFLPVGWTIGWTGVEVGNPAFWRCVGMIVGVYGVGYLCAARDPLRHWPIVLVGLLGKVFGPIGFLIGAVRGELPWAMGGHNLTNDLIWWVPFAVILYRAFDRHAYGQDAEVGEAELLPLAEAAEVTLDQQGEPLSERLAVGPVLLLAVRHAGCTFCRAELADLAAKRADLEAAGVTPAILTMSEPAEAAAALARDGLDDLPCYSDPDRFLYRALGLGRGDARELFSPVVWAKGLAPFLRHGVGPMEGDGFQMGGAFVLSKEGVLAAHIARNAADAPDLLTLASSI
ncbi:peroxiredoxin-like family protein [Alienimonas chondri]|uniref:Peroxiredoxin n=1 Tax=Alienimonas chondri TaxID=2681879 RepID=A0ABX1VDP3_9PLAN|nr:peroxiredoxin-like family protein [Alienimonas chondri]NNJ25640.1 hypothetical protein [Alienimonas chondri]